jgi:hypothetical protein
MLMVRSGVSKCVSVVLMAEKILIHVLLVYFSRYAVRLMEERLTVVVAGQRRNMV